MKIKLTRNNNYTNTIELNKVLGFQDIIIPTKKGKIKTHKHKSIGKKRTHQKYLNKPCGRK